MLKLDGEGLFAPNPVAVEDKRKDKSLAIVSQESVAD
jgi:hypothetical protein